MKLITEPEAGSEPVLEFIRKSKEKLCMNYYLLDHKETMAEIGKAVERKVQVRIIVDGHPYGGNQGESIDSLRKTGAQVNFAPSRFNGDEVFDHAKYMFNESEFMIGTANLTQNAFSKNREFIVEGDEKKILRSLQSIFDSDWNGSRAGIYARKILVVSPDSENRILQIIRDAKKLDIETEEIGDDKTLLEALGAKGKKLRMILPSTISKDDAKNVSELIERKANVKYCNADDLYIHAKVIHTGKYVFIGSQNFSPTSLMKNREVGILIKKSKLRKSVEETFSNDWKRSYEPGKKPRKKKS
ncbi:MAG: phospholipase D-like domain-containing protein [Candidatus Thermoplasmatota archaeon]|jgi:phosphatidylserine/phosphatidylglycerophosphate/cardiolipin synthase-like enzyme|nr:phospholipase D-like domain-containing protein [Candidatus Thermoplasmatota archaeon]MCL5988523.1 phospholipase D-like domain-containing protein [Candidatus Thermoplasmatota archaeon]